MKMTNTRRGCAGAVLLALLACAVHDARAVTTVSLCITVDQPTINVLSGMVVKVGDSYAGADVYNYFEGFGLDLMKVLFDQLLGYNYTTTVIDGFSHSLYLNRVGSCDISMGAFFKAYSREQCTVCPTLPAGFATSALANEDGWEKYACCVDFSHTFFPGGWSLMALGQANEEINVLAIIGQKPIIQAGCYAVLLSLAVAHVMWLFERQVFYDVAKIAKPFLFAPKYLDGLRDGAWFAGTTVLNNALHNKVIVTGLGRVLATAWVAFGMFLTSFVTSIFSSTLTTQQLKTVVIAGIADMEGKTVCMQEGFYDYFWSTAFPTVAVTKILVAEPQDCFPLVKSGAATAAFGIRETFISYFSTGQGAGFIVTPVVAPQDYAVVWGEGFAHFAEVNTAILNYLEGVSATSPAYQTSKEHWYGGDASQFVSGGQGVKQATHWNWPLIICTAVAVGLYLTLQLIVLLGSWLAKRKITHGSSRGSMKHLDFLVNATASLATALSTRVEQTVQRANSANSARLDSAMLGDDMVAAAQNGGSMSSGRGIRAAGVGAMPASPTFFKHGAVAPTGDDGTGSMGGGASRGGGRGLGGALGAGGKAGDIQNRTEYIVFEVSRRVTEMLKGPLSMQVQEAILEETPATYVAPRIVPARADSPAQGQGRSGVASPRLVI